MRGKGYTAKEIAKQLGKSEGLVKQLFSGLKAVNNNPELKKLMESNAGVTFTDIQEIRPLPVKAQLQIITEKISGRFKNKQELRARVWELKEQLSEKESGERVRRISQGCFIQQKNGFCRTLWLIGPTTGLSEIESQNVSPKGFLHHFDITTVAGNHQQVKVVDECQMFSKSSIGQSKS